MSRGISTEGLQTLDQMKQRAKMALRISEKVRMKYLWLRIDLNSAWYTDIAILSQNYQEPMALNTGPTVKRNAEVIGRNCRPTVLWPAFYMFRLKMVYSETPYVTAIQSEINGHQQL